MRLKITKLLGRFYPQNKMKFIFDNQLSIKIFFSKLRTVFIMFFKAVSSLKSAVASVRPCTLQNINKYQLWYVKLYKTHIISVNMTMLFKEVMVLIQIVPLLSIHWNKHFKLDVHFMLENDMTKIYGLSNNQFTRLQ